MFDVHSAFFLWTETPLHAGSGATVGVIDQPIQRDRQTGHPIVQPGGVKGAFRAHCRERWGIGKKNVTLPEVAGNGAETISQSLEKPIAEREWEAIFGPLAGDLFGGAISLTEARLMLFPVRSLQGVCAWITCPMVLARLARDLETAGIATPPLLEDAPAPNHAWVMSQSPLLFVREKQITLEEYTFTADVTRDTPLTTLAKWLVTHAVPNTPGYAYWQKLLSGDMRQSHLVVLNDSDFTEFTLHATNIEQRIRIDPDTGIVVGGALWIEESLPADSLLYTLLHVMPPFEGSPSSVPQSLCNEARQPSAEKVRERLLSAFVSPQDLVQIGGDATLGRGLTRMRMLSPQNEGGGRT